MIKYSIIYPYLKRGRQFVKTAESLLQWYRHRTDVELCIVMDPKNRLVDQDELFATLETLWDKFLVRIINNDIYSYSSAYPYNLASRYASGDHLVLSNPESPHMGDILGDLDRRFEEDPTAYYVYSCMGLRQDGTPEQWYQHSLHNPRCLHFCSAMRLELFREIWGFDERYTRGLYYEDNDFINKVRAAGIPVVQVDDPGVTHVWHDRGYQGRPDLMDKNKRLYQHIWEGGPA